MSTRVKSGDSEFDREVQLHADLEVCGNEEGVAISCWGDQEYGAIWIDKGSIDAFIAAIRKEIE